jgi:putative DNA primase/helicase
MSAIDALALVGQRFGKIDLACPFCGPLCKSPINRKRKVLRVWRHDPGFATFNCARCGEHGYARDDGITSKIDPEKRTRIAEAERQEADDLNRRQRRALEIWNAAIRIAGTLAERYLIGRGIDVTELPNDMVEVLRWHARCPWEQGRAPCLLALWTDTITSEPKAIHRTAISPQAERIDRMSLGSTRGCVIRLWPDESIDQGLVLGEGIETMLGAATRMEHRGTLLRPAWAAGDAGHIEDFPPLAGIDALTLLVDVEDSGRGRHAAGICAARCRTAGKEVIRLTPQTSNTDFADIIAREQTS